jgi:glucose-6-phosphate 1-dehydrogenase
VLHEGSSRSDALVLFGVTGDLAHKMIFPALYLRLAAVHRLLALEGEKS